MPERVKDAKEYLIFNEFCKVVKEAYGFKSSGEVHEFFLYYNRRVPPFEDVLR